MKHFKDFSFHWHPNKVVIMLPNHPNRKRMVFYKKDYKRMVERKKLFLLIEFFEEVLKHMERTEPDSPSFLKRVLGNES